MNEALDGYGMIEVAYTNIIVNKVMSAGKHCLTNSKYHSKSNHLGLL
jgi:hypothetical protein